MTAAAAGGAVGTHAAAAGGTLKAGFHPLPVDELFKESLHKGRAVIAEIDVIGVLPHVKRQHRFQAVTDGIVGV